LVSSLDAAATFYTLTTVGFAFSFAFKAASAAYLSIISFLAAWSISRFA